MAASSTGVGAFLERRAKLIVLGVALAVGILLPYVVNSFILRTMTLALIYGLFAMSINMLARGGLITLGHAAMFGTAAYGVGYTATHLNGGHVMQVLVGILVAMVVASVYALMSMRTTASYFIMVTLAQGMIVYGLAYSLQPITGGENGIPGIFRPPLARLDWQYYYLCLLVLLGCAALIRIIRMSPFGLALRGLEASETRLRMLGYNPTFHKFYGFLLASFFGAVAGILYVYYNGFVSPAETAFLTSATGVLMIILGGLGTMSGPLIGATIIVFIQNWLSVYVDRWPTVLGLIFIGMILFAPDGFVGGVTRLWHKWVVGPTKPSVATSGLHSAQVASATPGHPPGASGDGDGGPTDDSSGVYTS